MAQCTIVVPCYNEAQRLPVHDFLSYCHAGHSVRFLLVDDGSSDATPEVLETLHEADPDRFALLKLDANCGKAEAVRRGMLAAFDRGAEFVGFWDADLATPLEAIGRFCDALAARPGLQMILGSRVKLLGRRIERRRLRHFLGRIFATAASLVLRVPVYDTQCGAKLFRATPAVRGLFERPFRASWIFDVELLARWRQACSSSADGPGSVDLGATVYELPLDEWRDVAGSKLRPQDFFQSFFELVDIGRTYRRRPTISASASGPAAQPARPAATDPQRTKSQSDCPLPEHADLVDEPVAETPADVQ